MIEPTSKGLLTEEVFDLVAPVVGTTVLLLIMREQLDTLQEVIAEVDFSDPRWTADLRESVVSELKTMLGDVRRMADKVEGRLGE